MKWHLELMEGSTHHRDFNKESEEEEIVNTFHDRWPGIQPLIWKLRLVVYYIIFSSL